VDEYLCVVALARGGEGEAAFKARLSEFWTHVLRTMPDTFERVYAESSEFEPHDGALSRRYLVESPAVETLCEALDRGGLGFLTPDPDDVYSKYEAAPPEWFWIEH